MEAMIDIETFATSQDATIIEIGVALFELDPRAPGVGKTLHCVIDPQSQDREIELDTVLWWMEQGGWPFASEDHDKITLHLALMRLGTFFKEEEVDTVWANGPDFDLKILEDAFNQFSYELPWKFRQTRCVRTLKDLHRRVTEEKGEQVKVHARFGTKHHALDDAIFQVNIVRSIYKELL